MTRTDLARIIRKQIPLTRAMGLEVERCSLEKGVRFRLPLKPNRNHKGTAFGGTLVAGQALASWAWIMAALGDLKVPAEVVVQRQSSEFLKPVNRDFTVETIPVSEQSFARFLRTLRRRRKARLEIQAQVFTGRQRAATYRGDYVAIIYGE